LHRFIAPHDRAVLLEGGDGDGFVLEHKQTMLAPNVGKSRWGGLGFIRH
jgi:hypothetical protein